MFEEFYPDVVVNGELVPRSVIAQEAQNHQVPAERFGIAWRSAANAVAMRTLLLQEARKRDLRPLPLEISPGRYETDEEALIRDLLENEIAVETPSNEEVRAEWERDPSRFRSPPLWEVSHILVACDPEDTVGKEAARIRATNLSQQARVTPKDFPKLANVHSDCGSKASNGALGQLGPGDTLPEFEAALRSLGEGEITTTPILTRHGWHIIRLDAVAEGQVLPFNAVKQKISDALEKAAWATVARKFISDLVATSTVVGADFRPET